MHCNQLFGILVSNSGTLEFSIEVLFQDLIWNTWWWEHYNEGKYQGPVWDTADQDQDKELSAVFVAHIIDTLIKENDSEPEEFVYEDESANPRVQSRGWLFEDLLCWLFFLCTSD